MNSPLRSIMWHSLFAVALILIGFIMALIQSNLAAGKPSPLSGMIMLAGVIWFILNRLRLWWFRKQNRNQSQVKSHEDY